MKAGPRFRGLPRHAGGWLLPGGVRGLQPLEHGHPRRRLPRLCPRHAQLQETRPRAGERDLQLPILLNRGLHNFPPSAELFVPPDGGRDREPDAGEGDAARGARGHDGLLPHQGVGGACRHDREQAPRQMGSGQSLVRQTGFIHL